MRVYEYVTHPVSGVVHLVDQRVVASRRYSLTTPSLRTLCGREVKDGWVWGDETISGIAATCGSCINRRT